MPALPAVWPSWRASQLGPYQSSAGHLYVIAHDAGVGGVFQIAPAFKSTDGGATWTMFSQGVSTTVVPNSTIAVVQFGDLLFCIRVNALGGAKNLRIFDMATDSWGANFLAQTNALVGVSGYAPVYPVARSDGSLVVFHQGATGSIMGTAYRRVSYSIYSAAGTWGSPTEISGFGTTVAAHADVRGAVLGANDLVHFFWTRSDQNNNFQHRSLQSNGTLDANASAAADVFDGGSAAYSLGVPINRGGVIYFPYKSTGTGFPLTVGRFTSGTAPTNSDPKVVIDAASPEIDSQQPAMFALEGTTLHALWVRTSDGSLQYEKESAANAWANASVQTQPPGTVLALGANFLPNPARIGYVYDANGTVMYDEISLGPTTTPVSRTQGVAVESLSRPVRTTVFPYESELGVVQTTPVSRTQLLPIEALGRPSAVRFFSVEWLETAAIVTAPAFTSAFQSNAFQAESVVQTSPVSRARVFPLDVLQSVRKPSLVVPQLLYSNTLDGGADGETITAANSGGASGDPFHHVAGLPTYSNLFAKSGGLSMRINSPSGLTWARQGLLGSQTGNVWFRWHLYLPSLPGDNNFYPLNLRTSTDASAFILRILATGTIQARDSGNAGALSSGSVPVATGQWVRIEVRVNKTAGEVEWWLYNNADSLVESETQLATGVGTSIGANIDRAQYGQNVTGSNTTAYFDDLAVSTTSKIGPSAGSLAGNVMPLEAFPTARASRQLPLEWEGGVVALSASRVLPTETLAWAQTARLFSAERQAAFAKQAATPVESIGRMLALRTLSSESIARTAAGASAPAETITTASRSAVLPQEWEAGLIALSATRTFPAEAVAWALRSAATAQETLAQASQARTVQAEALSSSAARARVVPVETLAALARVSTSPYESIGRAARTALLAQESVTGAAATRAALVESVTGAFSARTVLAESIGRAARTLPFALESVRTLWTSRTFPFEWEQGLMQVAGARTLPAEWETMLRQQRLSPAETLLGVRKLGTHPSEAQSQLSAARALGIEVVHGARQTSGLPIDGTADFRLIRLTPAETLAQAAATRLLPAEWERGLAAVLAARSFPLDGLAQIAMVRPSHVEALQPLANIGRVHVERFVSLTGFRAITLERLQTARRLLTFPQEWLEVPQTISFQSDAFQWGAFEVAAPPLTLVSALASFGIDVTAEVLRTSALPVETETPLMVQVGMARALPIDSLMSAFAVRIAHAEAMRRETALQLLGVEALGGVLRSGTVPVEWLVAGVSRTRTAALETLLSTLATGSVGVETAVRVAAARTAFLEAMRAESRTAPLTAETLLSLVRHRAVPYESSGAVVVPVSMTRLFPLDSEARAAAQFAFSSESVRSLAASRTLPAEASVGVSNTRSLLIESLLRAERARAARIESLSRALRQTVLPAEAMPSASSMRAYSVESLAGLQRSAMLPAESTLALRVAAVLPTETVHDVARARGVSVESLLGVSRVPELAFEALHVLAVESELSTEWTEHVVAVLNRVELPLESFVGVGGLVIIPLDALGLYVIGTLETTLGVFAAGTVSASLTAATADEIEALLTAAHPGMSVSELREALAGEAGSEVGEALPGTLIIDG